MAVSPIYVWEPVTGCDRISPGCAVCPALDALEATGWGPAVRFHEHRVVYPLTLRAPHLVAVCPHGDLFHDDVEVGQLDLVFEAMEAAPAHRYQLLTKRAERMAEYVGARYPGGAPDGMAFGVSAEDQAHADARLAALARIPARNRYLTVAILSEAIVLGSAAEWLTAVTGGAPELPAERPEFVEPLRLECERAGVAFEWGGALL